MDGVAPIRFQISLLRKMKYDAIMGMSPHNSMTNASLGPFSTVVYRLVVIAPEAMLNMYHSDDVSVVFIAIKMMIDAIEGASNKKTKVMIDAELPFFMNELNRSAMPVSENT